MRNFTVIYFFHFIDDVHSFDILIEGREAQRMTNVCNWARLANELRSRENVNNVDNLEFQRR